MESVGEILREARHNRKATVEEAARATKIKPEILEQLEAEEFDRLASPAYAKGFIKLYAEYLGLDSRSVVETYVQSQGGLRRQGLQLETEAKARTRPPRELQLPVRSVLAVVVALTIAMVVLLVGKSLWARHKRSAPPPATVTTLPKADFDAYYKPKPTPAPELLESPSR